MQVPNPTDISEARISALRPVRVDDYGVVAIETPIHKEVKVSVMVGRGKFPIFPDYLDTLQRSHSRSPCTLLQKQQKRQA